MASDRKKVTLEVAVETEQGEIAALEKKMDEAKQKAAELKQQKIQMQINADTEKLSEVKSKINELENKKAELKVGVDDAEIDATEREIESLKQQQVNLELNVEKYKLDEIQSKMDAIEADPIEVQLNNQSAMEGLNQISDGFSRIKNSAMEVGQQFGDLLASAGKQETNFAFLKNAVGDAETARQKMSEINDIVAQLPGDDTALQGLLSSAAAKDSSLTADNLRSMANSATDYFSAMSYYGKSATEAQQDMTNYLLAGNTAELERSPILQGHIDKLKEANTVQERAQVLAEALNEEHWGGMGAMDTYNNKLETFNGMIERGRYTLGGMFQEGAKEAMGFLIQLDEDTNGLVGMGIAAAQMASPLAEGVIGLGQMATGIKAIKDTRLGDWAGTVKDKIKGIGSAIKNIDFASKFNSIKQGLINIGTRAKEAALSIGTTLKNALLGAAKAAKEAVIWLARTSRELLISAANALKDAASWLWDNTVKLASAAASKIAAAGQWLLNAAMMANPITLVVIAIVALVAILWYLYNTCEPVHDAIDAIWEGVSGAIQPIIDSVQWLIDKLTQLVSGDWSVTIDIAKAGASAGIGGVLDLANNDLSRGLVSSLLGDEALAQVDESMPAFKEKLTTSMNELLDAIWNDGTQGFLGWLANISGIDVNSYFSGLQNSLAAIPNWVNQAGTAAVQGFQSMYNGAVSWLNSTISNVMSFGSRLVSNMGNAARNAVSQFTSGIRRLGQALRDELNGMLSDAANFVGQIGQVMWNAAVNAWNNFLAGLQRHSPGIMMREFKAEMLGIVSTAEDTRDPLGDTMYSLANTAVKSWGNPNFGFEFEDLESQKFDSNSNGMSNLETLMNKIIELLRNQAPTGNTYQFTLNGDIDSEERMQKFIDAVRRDIEWDNEKAGRTV